MGDETTTGKAARNEQRKLTATYVNNVAIAFFIAGVAVPYFKYAYTPPPTVAAWWQALGTPDGMYYSTAAVFIGALAISLLLHWLARGFLDALED